MDLHLRGKRVLITGASKGMARPPPRPLPRKAVISALPPAAAIN